MASVPRITESGRLGGDAEERSIHVSPLPGWWRSPQEVPCAMALFTLRARSSSSTICGVAGWVQQGMESEDEGKTKPLSHGQSDYRCEDQRVDLLGVTKDTCPTCFSLLIDNFWNGLVPQRLWGQKPMFKPGDTTWAKVLRLGLALEFPKWPHERCQRRTFN